jgi:predicted nucleotidyltransferase
VSVLLGHGGGTFRNQMTFSTSSLPSSVAVGDFNNDTRLDIVVANSGTNNVSVLLGSSNVVFVNQTMLTTGNGSQPRSFAIGDFNNDNRMDIGVANSGNHNIGIFLGYGNMSFANQVTYSTGSYSSPHSVALGDFNNDTRLDIVVANYGSGNVGVFLGYGNGSFGNQTTYLTGSEPYSVAVGDFNNDTVLDIVVTNRDTDNLGILLGHGNGTFKSVMLVSMDYKSYPFLVVVGDFNNDRKLDFAVANNGTDSLNILLQTC